MKETDRPPFLSTSKMGRTTTPHYLLLPPAMAGGKSLQWLRRIHAWVGLWGALLGVMFAVTGLSLLHLDGFTKGWAIRTNSPELRAMRETVASDLPGFADQMRRELGQAAPATEMRSYEPKLHIWGSQQAHEPLHWKVTFREGFKRERITVDWWAGSSDVLVTTESINMLALLERLHMNSAGLGRGWLVLASAIAGAVILQAITGVLLWTKLHGTRVLAVILIGAATCATLVMMLGIY